MFSDLYISTSYATAKARCFLHITVARGPTAVSRGLGIVSRLADLIAAPSSAGRGRNPGWFRSGFLYRTIIPNIYHQPTEVLNTAQVGEETNCAEERKVRMVFSQQSGNNKQQKMGFASSCTILSHEPRI